MSESFVQVAVDGAGKQVDAVAVSVPGVGTGTNYRQVVALGDPSTASQIAQVSNGQLQVALGTAQMAALAPLPVVALTTANIAALAPLPFPTSQVAVLTTAQIAALQSSDTLDGLGNPINSLAAGTGQNGLMIAIGATNYFASAANSSTAQLAAGATFAGVIENAFNEPAISVLLTSDQPGLLTINQYIDLAGSRLISAWQFAIVAGQPFSRAFTLNGNYVSVAFQNTGASATTTYNQNVAYGTINAVTQQGNAPVSIFDSNGVQLGSDIYNGQAFLHVDTSHAATDGATYNAVNVPQVGVMAGKGIDGNVHPVAVDASGKLIITDAGGSFTVDTGTPGLPLNITGTVNIGTMPAVTASSVITDPATAGAQTQDAPLFVAIAGDPNGDWAGQNIQELLLDQASGISENVFLVNPPPVDSNAVNRGLALADAKPITLVGAVGNIFIIDTAGYQSLNCTSVGGAANVTAGNEIQGTFNTLTGVPVTFGSMVTAIVASGSYSFPCIARYIKITITTAGPITFYLRAAPWVAGYSNEPVNVAQLAGTAPVTAGVAGTQAVGGNIGVGVAQTANPLAVAGVDQGALTRRVLTDTTGAVVVGGVDSTNTAKRLSLSSAGALVTDFAATTPAQQSVPELLTQILGMLRVIAQYQYDMPGMVAMALTGNPMNPRSSADEPDALLNDMLNPATSFINMTN